MKDETKTDQDMKIAASHVRDLVKMPKKRQPKPAENKRLCFVITKNKSNSWVDDLYACGRITDLNRVYN